MPLALPRSVAMAAVRPSDWRELVAAEEALLDGGPGARTADAMRRFLHLVRADRARRTRHDAPSRAVAAMCRLARRADASAPLGCRRAA